MYWLCCYGFSQAGERTPCRNNVAIVFSQSSVTPERSRERPYFAPSPEEAAGRVCQAPAPLCALPGERAGAGTTVAGQLSHIWENPALIFKAMCCGSAEYGNFISKAECLLRSFVCQYLERCRCSCRCTACSQPFAGRVPAFSHLFRIS